MIVRPAVTDVDLEAWTRVRNLVEVENPTTLEDVRKGLRHQPETRHWIAEDGGRAVGCVHVSRSSVPDRAFLLPRVVPEARGRGVGTALVQATLEAIRELGCDTVRSHVDGADLEALRFAARHGFVEVDRQVELVRALREAEQPATAPSGIELEQRAAERVEELRPLLVAAVEDMPVVGAVDTALVDELVDDQVLEAARGLLRELEIQPDPAGVHAARAPFGLHLLDAPVGSMSSQNRLPLRQKRRHELAETLAVPTLQDLVSVEALLGGLQSA